MSVKTDVKTASRTLDFFEAFAEVRVPLALTDLARRLDMPISSCFQLTATLERRGYLYKLDRRGPYYPNGRLLQVSQRIAEGDPLGPGVDAVLERLRDATDESIMLGGLSDLAVVIQRSLPSRQTLRFQAELGERRTLVDTSLGRSLLSRLPEARRSALLDELGLAPAQRHELLADLERGAEAGFFVNRGRTVQGALTIGAPVRIHGADYAIAVAGPIERCEPRLDGHVRALLAARLELDALS